MLLVSTLEVWSFSTLYWTLAAILFVEGLLVVVATAALLVQSRRQRRDRRRSDQLEDRIQTLLDRLDDPSAEPLDESDGPATARDRRLLGEVLFDQLAASSGPRRTRLARVYHQLGYVERDRRRARSIGWQRRLEAMRRLSEIDSFLDRELLLEGLEDHPRIRLISAQILARRGDLDDLILALNALRLTSNLMEQPVHGLLVDVDDRRLAELLDHLDQIECPRVLRPVLVRAASRKVDGLASRLRDLADADDSRVRVGVCLAADHLTDSVRTRLLIDFLEDPCWEVRAHAARLLVDGTGSKDIETVSSAMADPGFWKSDDATPLTPTVTASIDGQTLEIRETFDLSDHRLSFFDDYLKTAAAWVPRLAREKSSRPARPRTEIVEMVP